MEKPLSGDWRTYLAGIDYSTSVLPAALAYRLAARVGRSRFSPRIGERATVADNLQIFLHPTAQRRMDLVSSYLENSGVNTASSFLYPRMRPAWLDKHLQMQGVQALKMAHAAGRGVLVLSAHQHHLALLGVSIGLLGLPIDAILMHPDLTAPPNLRQYVWQAVRGSESRFSGGQYIMVDYKNAFVRPVFRSLEAGRVLVSANDFPQSLAPKRRLQRPFLQGRLSVPLGSVQIALRYSTPVFSGFIHWLGGGRFTVKFQALDSSGGEGSVVDQYLAHLADALRRDPGSWEAWKWPDLMPTG